MVGKLERDPLCQRTIVCLAAHLCLWVNGIPFAGFNPLAITAITRLRSLLGITDVTFKRGQQRLAIIDKPLQG